MKVYFNAPLFGKKDYLTNYQAVHQAITDSGNELVASPVMDYELEDVMKEDVESASNYYKNLVRWIKQSEIVVFEVSYPSTSIGFEIAVALQHSRPVIALHTESAPKNVILESIDDERLQLLDYRLDEVAELVKDALMYAADQADTRFNFFVSPKIAEHLDMISKEEKTPRAVYLRQLIEEDMKLNEEYNGG